MPLFPSERIKLSVILTVFTVGVLIAWQIQKPKPYLPVLNPADLNPALVADSLEREGRGFRVGAFELVDQTGTRRTESDVEGQVRVVSYFFTTCQGICIDMARSFRRIQEVYLDDDRVRLMAHTALPKMDSVPVLAAYGENNDVDPERWFLLTGDPAHLNELARTQYFTVMEEGQSWDEHSFIHTENLVLIDQHGRLRGYFDGTSDEETDKLIEAIGWLLNELNEDAS